MRDFESRASPHCRSVPSRSTVLDIACLLPGKRSVQGAVREVWHLRVQRRPVERVDSEVFIHFEEEHLFRVPLKVVVCAGLLTACSPFTPSGSFNVGGTVAGLTGTGLMLQDNGGDDTTSASRATGPSSSQLASQAGQRMR